MRDALRLAWGTLTALPTRPPSRVDREVARGAMLAAPLVGLPVGVVWLLAHLAVNSGRLSPLVAGTLLVAGTALWSRGLHLDGLADTADGLCASRDPARSLEVMRTGNVGPGGAATLLLVLLLQVGALTTLLPSPGGTALALVALLTSRHTLAWGCWRRVPVARSSGLGAAVGASVPTAALGASLVAVLLLASAGGWLAGAPWYAAPVTVVAGMAGAGQVLLTAKRRLGGMTGDVLGAGVEVSLAAALVVASVIG